MRYFGSETAFLCRNFYRITLLFLRNSVCKLAVFIPQNLCCKNLNNPIIPCRKLFFLRNVIFLSFLLSSLISYSQSKNISGKLIDPKTEKGLSGLSISLNEEKKFTLVSGWNGKFKFKNIKDSVYMIVIRSKDSILKKILISPFVNKNIDLGDIELDYLPDKTLGNSISNFVFIFNSNAFKVNPDAFLKELILKLPTVTESEGNLYVQGEILQEIMIKGNIFFVDNNDAVLKNFPADFVDSIKIYDDISDQATGTKFDDDESAKAIDITPKREYDASLFGLVYGGIGNHSLYNMGANINYFKGVRQFSLVQQINNINQTTYSPYNLNDMLGDNTSGTFDDRASNNMQTSILNFVSGGNDFVVDQNDGINANSMFGASYFDQTGKWFYYGNYFFNKTDNNTLAEASRQYFSSDNENLTYSETSKSVNTNINHRFRAKTYYYIDKSAVLKISPKFYMQKTEGTISSQGIFNDASGISSAANSVNTVDVTANKALAIVNYLKSFAKPFRSLTVDVTPYYFQKKGGWSTLSYLTYNNNNFDFSFDTLDAYTNYKKSNAGVTGDILYTEPIGLNSSLLFGYLVNYSYSEVNKEVTPNNISFNTISSSALDSLFSSSFDNLFVSNAFKLMFQYRGRNWRINPGISYQYSILNNKELVYGKQETDKSFQNLLPVVYFTYSISDKINLKINYKTYVQTPSNEQLQTGVNMSNPLNLSEGNINLKPSLNRLFDIRYTHILNNRIDNFYVYSGALYSNDYIGTQSYPEYFTFYSDSIPVNINRPVNLDEYFKAFGYVNYNTRFKSIASGFNANINARYYHIPNMDKENTYFSNQTSIGLGLSLNSDISESVDFILSSNTGWNQTSSSLSGSSKNIYLRQNTYGKLNLLLFKSIVVSTDLLHQYNHSLSGNFNDSYILWNASIGYKFLKDKSIEFRFSVHDILNQNANIQHNVTDYYIEDVRTNNLQRYFLVSFLYHLKN